MFNNEIEKFKIQTCNLKNIIDEKKEIIENLIAEIKLYDQKRDALENTIIEKEEII